MNRPNRRSFASAATAAAAGAICSRSAGAAEVVEGRTSGPPNPIAVSTYSFWRFRDDSKLSIGRCIDEAARMGFDAVEILQMQMESEEPTYLQGLKQQAFLNGLGLCSLSTHQGFLSPDPNKRQENVDHTIRAIELAYSLGIPTMRVNTGRWGTSKDFDELMAIPKSLAVLRGAFADLPQQ